MATTKLQALWNHPAGPKTIHFWAPTFKWGISIANIVDFQKPPETLSYPQQMGIYSSYVLHVLVDHNHWTHLVTLQHCSHSGMMAFKTPDDTIMHLKQAMLLPKNDDDEAIVILK
ncbi:hypothetical protein YC2023_116588 [Brassica napus]